MFNRRWFHVAVSGVILPSLFLLVVLLVVVFAAGQQTAEAQAPAAVIPQAFQQPAATTVLSVTILSSPWATLDNTDPAGTTKNVPRVMLVEARVTNMGLVSATDVVVELDYNEDPANDWELLGTERPLRHLDQLEAGAEYYAYWFATYSSEWDTGHTYTVTASAANADPVSTSDNDYGNPAPGETVRTRRVLRTGNNGLSLVNADVIVGVAFTVTTEYNLGQGAERAGFSPAGNLDFDPGAFRLLDTQVRFYDDPPTQEQVIDHRIYIENVPDFAEKVETIYTFIAVRPAPTRLCAYTTVDYSLTPDNAKYDNDYCSAAADSVIEITGTLGFSLTKQASSSLIQQGEPLTYSLDYTNTGDLPMVTVWAWDDVNPSHVEVLTNTIDPLADPAESTGSRVAWYLGTVPAPPDPSSSGQLTFSVLVDGNGADLANGTQIVNRAYFGINEGALPADPAYTATYTTTVQAPAIAIAKQASQSTVVPGDALTFTVQITNSGSVAATGVVITDALPAGVDYVSGGAGETSRNGQILVWTNLGPIPAGGSVALDLPVTVAVPLADGTQLTNTVTVAYQNPAGYAYTPKQAEATVSVSGPTLAISKQAHVGTVLAGRALTYTLTYTNSGAVTATNVIITDTVPADTTYVSCTGGTSCSEVGGVVQWNLNPLAEGGGGAVGFTVLTDADLATDSFINNNDYGIRSDETGLVTGPGVSTRVVRKAAVIDGHTFVDDGDGHFDDVGESPMVGITMTLPAATTPTLYSDDEGYFRFVVESEQAISVTAGLRSGYFRTTPGTVITYTVYEVTQTVDFGYAPITDTFGSIYGTVFNDADKNGVQGMGELGIPGVTVTLDGVETTQTDLYGTYTFSTTVAGPHRVVETDPSGYLSTTPNEVHVVVSLGAGVQVDFGDAPDTSDFATIYGTVFDDADNDGQWDAGELGIPGVTVTMDGGASTTTGPNGGYFFTTAIAGVHVLVETDPAGYRSTTPNEVHVFVDLGQAYVANFGDILDSEDAATILGTVFEDSDGDGQFDPSEVGLEGVSVTLDGTTTRQTDSYGNYSFSTTAGIHAVVETDPAGYISTTPNEVHSQVALGQTVQVDFGDALDSSDFAIIYGTVYNDANNNGQWNAGELGLPGVTVTLDGGAVTTTGPFGGYLFKVATAGVHVVVESDPAGYRSTTPNERHVAVVLGSDYEVNFGDRLISAADASIIGTVFEDADGDGNFDPGEVGLANVTVTLDGAAFKLTDQYGGYSFPTTAGVHAIVETDPPGYFSTTPNTVVDDVALGSTLVANFGDALGTSGFAVLMGTVYVDTNRNQQRDPNELGIPGVKVTLDGGATRTTDAHGRYSFKTTVAGNHTLVETDPVGYLSTTPNTVVTTAVLGQTSQVDFGDVPAGSVTCSGDAYEPDNSSVQANLTDADVTYSHNFCVGASSAADQDWRVFTAHAGFEYTISTTSYGQRADTFLAIFDGDGSTLLAANDDYEGTTDFSSRIVWQAPEDGNYFIRTTNRAGLTGQLTGYRIRVTVDEQYETFLPVAQSNYAPPQLKPAGKPRLSSAEGASAILAKTLSPNGVINHCGPDDYEIDDIWQEAAPIVPGIVQAHTFDSNPVLYAADKDFVWVDLYPGQMATFEVPSTSNTSTLLELYDEEGRALNVTGSDELSWTAADRGRYYLSVSPSPAAFGCTGEVAYTLSVETSPFYVTYLPITQRP